MLYEHLGARPRIHDTAVIAPTAVLSGDVEIGPHCQVLHGAVITAEGGPITLGEHVIVMENALIRATAADSVHIGSHTLLGTLASIAGATIGEEVFLASGARVFNGAHIGARSEIRVNAIVQRRAALPEGTVVPIGWVATGDPVQLYSPDLARSGRSHRRRAAGARLPRSRVRRRPEHPGPHGAAHRAVRNIARAARRRPARVSGVIPHGIRPSPLTHAGGKHECRSKPEGFDRHS